MRSSQLVVSGAFVFTPEIYPDDRGLFVSPMQQAALLDTVGVPSFPAAQASYSKSRRGVVRGIHFTRTPPGGAKYVYCPQGRALDIVIDVRVGSPTFGRWDTVQLDPEVARGVYMPIGVGHAYVALADDTVVAYLLSAAYVPENELAMSVFDPALGLPIPDDIEPILSARDTAALTLEQTQAAGLLPDYATCRELAETVGSSP